MGETMIDFDHVGKRFSKRSGGSIRDAVASRLRRRRPDTDNVFWALDNVSFDVGWGEALGMVGHNGAGKSTILKLLAGITRPTRGRVEVRGRTASLIELGAGFHPDLTGRENVYLNGSILGLRRAEIDRQMDSIIDFAGLERFIDMPVKHYSSGMHARLGFAVAVHVEPEILLIDEVLSVGDFAFQQKCYRRMEEFRRSGVAIVFVSHNLSAIASLCSKAIMLGTGRVVAAGSPLEVIDAYTRAGYQVVSDEEEDRVADLEHGRITLHMEIMGADLCDADGRPVRSLLSGTRASLGVSLRARQDITNPIVDVTVRNAETTEVYTTNSAMHRVSIGSITAGEEMTVHFPLTLNLCNGTYSVAASVVPANGGVMMDARDNLVTFEMLGDETGAGIADLRSSIIVQRRVERGGHEQSLPA